MSEQPLNEGDRCPVYEMVDRDGVTKGVRL